MLHVLDKWISTNFKPEYYDVNEDRFSEKYTLKKDFNKDKVDIEKLELWVYILFLRVKYKKYPSSALKDLKIASKVFGSETAKKYLNTGTGLFKKEDIYLKNNNVECIANDVLATFTIKIKSENLESYNFALDFIINLLKKDFPNSYTIKLSSKSEKKFLPIKGIAKSSTHRFFVNCLQHKKLHDKMEQYALIAMKEFEWYSDVTEGEKSLLPGSYAVFGLGLTTEKYFPLIHKYFKVLDDEHQMAHRYFISNLIDNYGITKTSIKLICDGIVSAQFEMKYKNLSVLMNKEENLKFLISDLKKRESYVNSEIYYSIWGRNYTKVFQKLNSNLKQELLELVK